jgi:hypothetical protein
MNDLMDILDLQQLDELRVIERRDHLDPMLYYNEEEFRRRFRVPKVIVQYLCEKLNPLLSKRSTHERNLSVSQQLLMALRFLATGSMQLVCADTVGMSQASVSRCIMNCMKAIISLRPLIIKFPEDLNAVKHSFYNIAGFPGVIGLVDGSHIPICKPSGIPEPEIFRCRKGFYSINVQITCGPDYRIYHIVARWPGSTHDNRIFENSTLCFRMQNGQLPGIILADGGYGNKRYLHLP